MKYPLISPQMENHYVIFIATNDVRQSIVAKCQHRKFQIVMHSMRVTIVNDIAEKMRAIVHKK